MKFWLASIMALTMILTSCSKDDDGDKTDKGKGKNNWDSKAIPDQVAQGVISDVAWEFKSGRATADETNRVFIELWNQEFANPCELTAGSDLKVHMVFPSATGEHKITANALDMNVAIFVDVTKGTQPEANIYADYGGVEILNLTENELSAKVEITSRINQDKVIGTFKVNFCKN